MKRRYAPTAALPIRLGLIGTEEPTASSYLEVLHEMSEVEVAALAEEGHARLHQVADRYIVQGRYTDYRELLDNEAVEAVAIVLAPRRRPRAAEQAIEAGKHVLLAHPAALRMEDVDRLQKAARASGVHVLVDLVGRAHPLATEAATWVRRGVLGPTRLVRSLAFRPADAATPAPWRNRWREGGGTLFELAAPHLVLWRHLLDSDVEELAARCHAEGTAEEQLVLTGEMSCGTLASGSFCLRGGGENVIEVHGTRGWLRLALASRPKLRVYGQLGTREMWRLNRGGSKSLPLAPSQWGRRERDPRLVPVRATWRRFIDCFWGETHPPSGLAESRRILELVRGAAASMGRPLEEEAEAALVQRDPPEPAETRRPSRASRPPHAHLSGRSA